MKAQASASERKESGRFDSAPLHNNNANLDIVDHAPNQRRMGKSKKPLNGPTCSGPAPTRRTNIARDKRRAMLRCIHGHELKNIRNMNNFKIGDRVMTRNFSGLRDGIEGIVIGYAGAFSYEVVFSGIDRKFFATGDEIVPIHNNPVFDVPRRNRGFIKRAVESMKKSSAPQAPVKLIRKTKLLTDIKID
mgnify:CR=1 FL=1